MKLFRNLCISLATLLCGLSIAHAEAKTNKAACAREALIPDLGANGESSTYEYGDLGVLTWRGKDGLKVATESGTFTINSRGSCSNTDPNQTISKLVVTGLNADMSTKFKVIEKDPKNKERFTKEIRAALHHCEGFSVDVNAAVSKWWQKYNTAFGEAPKTEQSEGNK